MADDGLPMQIRYCDRRAVGGVGAGGRVMPRHTAGLPTISVTALDDGSERDKGPGRGGAPVPLAPLVSRLVRRTRQFTRFCISASNDMAGGAQNSMPHECGRMAGPVRDRDLVDGSRWAPW